MMIMIDRLEYDDDDVAADRKVKVLKMLLLNEKVKMLKMLLIKRTKC